jgi:6-phosphogluconolactonase (cycloisomerase 2 family)
MLALNGSGNLSVSGNGAFTFPTGLAGGSSYTVTVAAQPNGPSQLCTVSNGTGSVATANITTVSVSCGFVGRFAYVSGTKGITAYSINHSTGLLSPLPGSPYAASINIAESVTLHPNRKLVYAVDPGYQGINGLVDGAIAVYSIDNTTGIPTAIAGSPFTVAASPYMLAFHPSGKFAFAPNWLTPNQGASVFSIDANTGAPTQIAGSPFACAAPVNSIADAISVAVAPSGSFLYVGTVVGGANSGVLCAYSIDPSTGSLTALAGSPYSTGPTLTFMTSLAFDPSGKFLYATGPGNFGAFTVDTVSGALTPIAGAPDLSLDNPVTVAVDPAGKFLYVSDDAVGSNAQIFVYSIDPTTGSLTPISGSPFPSVQPPYSISIDPSGDLAYVPLGQSAEISVYFVNKATGALTSTGSPISNGAGTDPRAIAILQ